MLKRAKDHGDDIQSLLKQYGIISDDDDGICVNDNNIIRTPKPPTDMVCRTHDVLTLQASWYCRRRRMSAGMICQIHDELT